ncbi:hypothetical protein LptCag_0181 [Leptospirillum ferriphilum]|uniref:Uncharacterized protein n=1 Tax=Leptospirillum ferriphilum TaxID=178606 RepID=A0A094W7W2_9BACT|nr:hypothetical protein LptCag_0181 [Leptospirillum ferriphilum]
MKQEGKGGIRTTQGPFLFPSLSSLEHNILTPFQEGRRMTS